LYFRLSVFPVTIPPLRERPSDIPLLARYFIERYCTDLRKPRLTFSPAAEEALQAYQWPGNVRELQNCIERAVILTDGGTILPQHLNLSFVRPAAADGEASPWDQVDLSGTLADACRRVTAEVERRKIVQALRETGGSRPRAAALLQVTPKTLSGKMKEYGIDGTAGSG